MNPGAVHTGHGSVIYSLARSVKDFNVWKHTVYESLINDYACACLHGVTGEAGLDSIRNTIRIIIKDNDTTLSELCQLYRVIIIKSCFTSTKWLKTRTRKKQGGEINDGTGSNCQDISCVFPQGFLSEDDFRGKDLIWGLFYISKQLYLYRRIDIWSETSGQASFRMCLVMFTGVYYKRIKRPWAYFLSCRRWGIFFVCTLHSL